MAFNTTEFSRLIADRLRGSEAKLCAEFLENEKIVGTKFLAIDDFLPTDIAHRIYESYKPTSPAWREMKSFREKKMTTKKYGEFPVLLGEVTFSIQDPEVVKLFAQITGIDNQMGDPGLYAGGLSMMRKGDFLNPHIDNSHDQDRKLYRRLNLLYYVTPDWKEEDGGNLELWDIDVKKKVTIHSKFNRMVLMETDSESWHSVSKVTKPDSFRCCVSNYYFSPQSPTGTDYFHITRFKGRPDEPLKRFISDIDSVLRTVARSFKRSGFGKKDLYQGPR